MFELALAEVYHGMSAHNVGLHLTVANVAIRRFFAYVVHFFSHRVRAGARLPDCSI